MKVPKLQDVHQTWLSRLENNMWIERGFVDVAARGTTMNVRGLLKPQPTEGGGRVVRRMYLDVFDQVLDDLAELGACHIKHPDFRFEGQVVHCLDKPDDFAGIPCEVEFTFLVTL